MRGNENPLSDLDKILQNGIGIPEVITFADFDNDRLRGLGAAGVKFGHFHRLSWSSLQ